MLVRSQRLLSLILSLVVAGTVVACSRADGRSLPPPDPASTTTAPSTPALPTTPASAFTLRSTSFPNGQILAANLTCQGLGTSPDFTWTAPPADAVELALVVRDQTEGGYLHWVVTGIDPTTTGFSGDGLPEGALTAVNSSGSSGWSPPCPPAGTGVHTYEATLYALKSILPVEAGAPGTPTVALIEGARIAQASITATYSPDAPVPVP